MNREEPGPRGAEEVMAGTSRGSPSKLLIIYRDNTSLSLPSCSERFHWEGPLGFLKGFQYLWYDHVMLLIFPVNLLKELQFHTVNHIAIL